MAVFWRIFLTCFVSWTLPFDDHLFVRFFRRCLVSSFWRWFLDDAWMVDAAEPKE